MQIAHTCRKGTVQPAVELLVTSTGRDVLLTHRDDEHWSGYHIPGGFVGCGESLQMACACVSRTELGVDSVFERLIGHCVWLEHPSAAPLDGATRRRDREPLRHVRHGAMRRDREPPDAMKRAGGGLLMAETTLDADSTRWH